MNIRFLLISIAVSLLAGGCSPWVGESFDDSLLKRVEPELAEGQLAASLKDEVLSVVSKTAGETVLFEFKHCMNNELFTFARVSLYDPQTRERLLINNAYSDNIGPYDIYGGSWAGGDHCYGNKGIKTARTDSVKITIDGTEITGNDAVFGHCIEIQVYNTIFNPTIVPANAKDILTEPLLKEEAVYLVSGNSVDVTVSQKWVNKEEVILNTYYGMQSVCVDESEILTPGGVYNQWTTIDKVEPFINKSQYPEFRRILERNAAGNIQSMWLFDEGLGNRRHTFEGSHVFQRAVNKSYHVLMKWVNRSEKSEQTFWHGIYSWHKSAIETNDNYTVYEIVTSGKSYLCVDVHRPFAGNISLPGRFSEKDYQPVTCPDDFSYTLSGTSLWVSTMRPSSLILGTD